MKRSVVDVELTNGASLEEKGGASSSKGRFAKHRLVMILELEHDLSNHSK